MVIPVPNYDKTKEIFSKNPYGCGCNTYRSDNIRRDCYWYHCEHQMGASIDCCTLCDGLGECPCFDNCKTYISKEEATALIRDFIKNPNDGNLEIESEENIMLSADSPKGVDVAPIVHGQWVTDSDGLPVCSVCDEVAMQMVYCDTMHHGTLRYDIRLVKTPFCPKCGAKMDGNDNTVKEGD